MPGGQDAAWIETPPQAFCSTRGGDNLQVSATAASLVRIWTAPMANSLQHRSAAFSCIEVTYVCIRVEEHAPPAKIVLPLQTPRISTPI